MSTTSETMRKNWQDPEFRERAKKGRDRYYTALMKKRLVELVSSAVEYQQTDLEEFREDEEES